MDISHESLIDSIGTKEVRERYGLSRQALHNWRRRGVPYSRRVSVARFAAERGVVVPADFFEGLLT